MPTNAQARLVRALAEPARHGSWCTSVSTVETHISYVLLTGRYAYKIKKAVDLGFLDFTTLAARHFYCDRELQLNQPLAPTVYMDVVAITGSPEAPRIGGDGPAIEYAVRMHEFPQDALLSHMLARGDLTPVHIDALADVVAAFHASRDNGLDPRFGSAADIRRLALDNFATITPLLTPDDRQPLTLLRGWTEREHARRAADFAARRVGRFVRECHGDLHLGNVAVVNGRVTLFDGIEFNDGMRWGDVMSDVAFLVMDMEDRQGSALASRFLNAYLERTGDYDGVKVLRFYLVYRAMVRAKIACLRAHQDTGGPALVEYRGYLSLATRLATPAEAGIVITHGPSGSGKTAVTQGFIETAGAIRVRTDVERMREHAADYSPAGIARTYERVAHETESIVNGGYVAVVDGTFLQRGQRDRFRALAATLDVPFVIVDVTASADTARDRIGRRRLAGTDPSDADEHVLDRQLATADPLAPGEQACTVRYDSETPLARAWLEASWTPVLDRLHAGVPAGMP